MKRTTLLFLASFAIVNTYAQNKIESTGNVGIGTLTPDASLAIYPLFTSGEGTNVANAFVAGTHHVLGNAAGSYLYPFEFQHSNTSNIDRLQFAPYRRVGGPDWGGTGYRMQFAVDNSFTDGSKAFLEIGAGDPNISGGGFISLGTASLDRLAITNAGYVGIGTLSPKEELSVNGKIRAKEVKVESANWPDYVFKKDYNLPALSSVQNFITQHQHLPEVPSEKDIADNGLNLGEMNKILLKKVEELTLYLIELKKEVDLLKNTKK